MSKALLKQISLILNWKSHIQWPQLNLEIFVPIIRPDELKVHFNNELSREIVLSGLSELSVVELSDIYCIC